MRVGHVFLIAVLICGALCGQSTTTPPPGDPDVFLAFFRMYDRTTSPSVGKEVSPGVGFKGGAAAASRTGSATDAPADAAAAVAWQRRLGLSDADFATLNRWSATLKSQTEQLRADGSAYWAEVTARKIPPDQAKLQGFRASEIALARQAMASLKAQLSPGGSQALFQFIDGEFRAATHTAPLGGRK
jgi:hypothetical protein